MSLATLVLALKLSAGPEPLGPALEGLPAPFPVQWLPAAVEGQDVRLAWFDVVPTAAANGRAVLLLHGKNFWGDAWADVARALAARGYRVVVPDELGFGRSSKPDVHYSFELLSLLTRKVLDAAGVKEVAVVGHSMGGMLAVRFALMFPERTTHLVLENPIGLEDYRERVPYRTIEEWYRGQLGQTQEGLRKFYQGYFARWKSDYERWPEAVWRQLAGAEGPRVALASALTYEMIYTQPVVQDLPRLRVPTLLVIGQSDRTAVGRAFVSKEVAAALGDYPALGKRAARAIPGARLVELEGVGHVPHMEAPERFLAALLELLGRP
jgi:pimeloyl-ACP methyl ester carboxylesterase